jgi:hypothetical protein
MFWVKSRLADQRNTRSIRTLFPLFNGHLQREMRGFAALQANGVSIPGLRRDGWRLQSFRVARTAERLRWRLYVRRRSEVELAESLRRRS